MCMWSTVIMVSNIQPLEFYMLSVFINLNNINEKEKTNYKDKKINKLKIQLKIKNNMHKNILKSN